MRRIWITGIILILLCIPYPVIAATVNPYQKIVEIHLIFENNLVRVESSEIRYGTAPAPDIQTGTIKGILSDSQHHTFNEFYIRDPRVLTGDSLTGGPGGTGTIRGYTEYVQPVEFGIVLPYTQDFHYLNLIDTTTGFSLVNVDLTNDIARFAQMYPADPDLQVPANPVRKEDSGLNPSTVLILGSLLISGSACTYLIQSHRWNLIKSLSSQKQQKIWGGYLYQVSRDEFTRFAARCKNLVESFYHHSPIVNFAIIFSLVVIIVFSPVPLFIQNSVSPPAVLLIILDVLTFYLLETTLITTHRALVTDAWSRNYNSRQAS
jgi:hypothetical protein